MRQLSDWCHRRRILPAGWRPSPRAGRAGPLVEAGPVRNAPGPARPCRDCARRCSGRRGRRRVSLGLAARARERARAPQGARLLDHTSVTRIHRRSRPGSASAARHARDVSPPSTLEHDRRSNNRALADFVDYLHGPSPPVEGAPIGGQPNGAVQRSTCSNTERIARWCVRRGERAETPSPCWRG